MDSRSTEFLVIVKNSSLINREEIKFESNGFIVKLLRKLYQEGFILSYSLNKKPNFENNTKEVFVKLRYMNTKPLFGKLKVVSTLSFQLVLSLKNICRIVAKKRFFLFSTNFGLLTLNECKEKGVGGILLFVC